MNISTVSYKKAKEYSFKLKELHKDLKKIKTL